MSVPLLETRGLGVSISRGRRTPARTIVADIDLMVDRGEVVGLVGESGSGKSMTLKSIMRLLPHGAGVTGRVLFEGADVPVAEGAALRDYRARDVAMIHQDPRSAINPVRTIGDFLVEGVRATGRLDRAAARERAVGLLREVGIDDAERRMRQYPHELSGGLLQRVMIVMALMSEPGLILADEPTTALDVTVQSEVMAILMEEVRARGLGLLFVTHDLDLAAAVTDTIVVMYAGRIVERGEATAVAQHPAHPYSVGLLASRPRLDRVERPVAIPGKAVAAFEAGEGCAFAPRCPFATDLCRSERPPLREVDARTVACHHAEAVLARGAEAIR